MQRDYYMEKAQAAADPILRKALGRMVRAARHAFNAKSDLYWAMQDLERHPDYIKAERCRKARRFLGKSMTLAWWVHMTAHAALHDAELEDVGDWLLVDGDAKRAEANMRHFLEEDASDRARFARRKGQRAKAIHRPAIQAAA